MQSGVQAFQRDGRVLIERHSNDDRFEIQFVLCGQQFAVIFERTDVFGFVGAKFFVEADPGDGVTAFECAIEIGGPQIGHRHDVHVFWRMFGDQHVAFIAHADERRAHGVAFEFVVAEVKRSEPRPGRGRSF